MEKYWHLFGTAVAGFGAAAHVGFAYIETIGWRLAVVRRIAPAWLEGLEDAKSAEHADWARHLALNIGVYNLMLAIGLGWTCWAFAIQSPMARTLGVFFAIWLLGVAGAALYTQVFRAFVAQGLLGVLLLLASAFH
jgi:uncharacterized membrane protein